MISLIMIPVLLIAGYSLIQTRRQLIRHIYEEQQTLASLSAKVLSEKLDHLKDIGLSLSTRPVFRQYIEEGKWDAAIHLMKDIPNDFPYISRVFIADTSGTSIAAEPSGMEMKKTKEADLDWYRGVSKNWLPYLSEVYKSEESKTIVSALAMPVKDANGKVNAVLVLQVNIPRLLDWSSEVNIGKSGFIYIVDHKGHIAASPDYARANLVIDYSSVPVVQKVLRGERDVEISYNPLAKENRLSAYEQVTGYHWAVIIQQRATIAFSVNKNLRFLFLFYSLIILATAGLAWLIIKEITRRKKSEQELDTYARMVDDTHVLIRNMDDKIRYWNKGMEQLYGWKKKEVIGTVTHALFATEFPQPLPEIENILQKTDQWNGELKHTRKDGSILFVSSHWHLHRDVKGVPDAILETNNDITELKTAEEKLIKSEASIHLLIDNVKDYAIFMLDINGKVASWNNGAAYIKGYQAEEILGKSLAIFYSKEDIEKGEPYHNLEMAAELGHYEKEGWRYRKDGTKFWANVVFTALKDKTGTLYGYSKITRDITERKKAQEDRELLSRQINESHDAIYTVDEKRIIRSWNRGAEILYGFTREDVLGKDPNEILKTDITDDELDVALEEIHKHNYWTGELKRKTKSGKDIWVHSSTSTIKDKDGIVKGFVAVSFDVTDQKKLREEVNYLASIVEQSSEAIMSRGLDRRFISWNKGAEKLYGYSSGEVIGKTAAELGLTRLNGGEIMDLEKQLSGSGIWEAEMNYYRKDGSVFFGAVSGNVLKNEKGEMTSFNFIVKDISLRKQLEEKLKKYNDELEQRVIERTEEIYKSEKRFKALIENNYDIISLMDEQFNVFYRSPSATRITGWTDEEVLKINGTINIHPDDKEKASAIVRELKSKPGKTINTLFRNRHKDGHYLWVEGTVINLLQDEDVKAIVFNFRDVTERVNAEKKIQSSEKRFRALIENNYDMISMMDESFKIIYRSPSSTRITGWTDEDLEADGTTKIHPDDLESTKITLTEIMTNPGHAVKVSFRNRHKDGHYLWLEGSVINLLQDEDVNAIVFNFRDVTERIEAEEKAKQTLNEKNGILESIGDAFFAVDKNWTVTYWNRIAETALNVPKHAIVGKNLWDIFSDSIHSISYKKYHQAIATNQVVHFEDYYAGLNKWYEISAYPSENGLSVYFKDTTEGKKARELIMNLNTELEEKVIKRTDELQAANKELEAFAYSVSHDLRAPLRGIVGFTAILEEDYSSQLDDEARRITSVIKSNTLKMGNLIDDLLTFSRMGRKDIEKTAIDTKELVEQLIKDIEKLSDPGKIEWTIHPLLSFKGDINTMRQVWINLISNAVKYSGGKEQQRIEIGSYYEDNQVVFFIKDNGAGFDMRYRDKLFKVFQRLHGSDEFEGTGVGLAIVEKIIARHGGKVWAEGEVEKGACFYFSIPTG